MDLVFTRLTIILDANFGKVICIRSVILLAALAEAFQNINFMRVFTFIEKTLSICFIWSFVLITGFASAVDQKDLCYIITSIWSAKSACLISSRVIGTPIAGTVFHQDFNFVANVKNAISIVLVRMSEVFTRYTCSVNQ